MPELDPHGSHRERDPEDGPPGRALARRLQLLETLQLAVLVCIAGLAVGITIYVARANLNAGQERASEQRLQNSLVELRDRFRVAQRNVLERRLAGVKGITPGTVAAVKAGRAFVQSLAAGTARDPNRVESEAIRDALRGFDELVPLVEGASRDTSPIGSPVDKAALARFSRVRQSLEDAVERWLAVNQARVLESENRATDRTRNLMIWLPVGIGLLGATGLLVWILLGRARRRVSGALGEMAQSQSLLRETTTRVAAETDLAAVFGTVARAAAEVIGVEGGVVTRFEQRHGEPVGYWHAPRDGRPEEPPQNVDLWGATATALVSQSGVPTTVRYAKVAGSPDVDQLRARGYEAGVAVPVLLGRELWGAVAAASTRGELSPDAVGRLGHLADLVTLSLQNADERQRLTERAATDPLTGLGNHRVFQERLREEVGRAIRHRRGLALVLLDLDHFKEVNDTHGHQVGDTVLVEVARRLSGQVRGSELISRIGGEEFAWLLPEADGLDAWQAAERARRVIAESPFSGIGHVTLSGGVCDIHEAGGHAGDLFRFADGALYWAKLQGRNATYRYTPEVVAELSAQERTERLVRTQALTALHALARAVDARDRSARRHSERVADLSTLVATEMGWSGTRIDALRQAALMHDVGKLGVPDEILLKPRPLDPDECALIRGHAVHGAEIVAGVLAPEQVGWVRHHHERWDGTGYPDGLAGENIPDGARILAVAEAWDAMISGRPYSPGVSPEEALDECRRQAGKQFSADVVDALALLVDAGRIGNPPESVAAPDAGF